MPDNDLSTGRTRLNSQLVEGARNLAGPAADIAAGASLLTAASNQIKAAALEKLLGPTAVFAGGLVGVLSIIRNIVRESGILERGLGNIARLQQIQGKFETLLKGAELAKQRIQELYEFTANSPFKFESVAEANRVLEALTRGAFSGSAAMKLVGDSAAAAGQDIADTAEEVGKLYNALANGSSVERIAQRFQLTGIVTDGLLGKLQGLENLGATFAEKWDVVTQSLAANQGGMKNEMHSLDALQSKLEQADAQMAQAFGEPFKDAQAKSIEVMTKATQNLTPVLKAVGSDLAVVSGLITNFKTGVVENTLATAGMATALRGAWEVGKNLFLTLSAITAVRGALGVGKAVSFVSTAASTAKKSLAGSLASDAGIAARAAGTVATEALAAGNIRLAATEAAVAAKFYTTAGAAAVQAAAIEGAAGATGLAAIQNGVLAGTSAIAAGGLTLLGRVAVGVGSAIKGAFVTAFATPLGIAITSIFATVTAYKALSDASTAAEDDLKSVKTAVAELNAELKRTEDAFRTTDDWAVYMSKITDEIGKAELAASKFHDTMNQRSGFQRTLDFVSGADIDYRRTGRILDARAGELRAQREASLRYLPTLGMGTREAEAYSRDLRTAKDRSDTAFQNKLSLADDRAAVKLMNEEIARLDTMNAKFLAVRSAQERFDRRPEVQLANARFQEAHSARDAATEAAQAAGVDASGTLPELTARRDNFAAIRDAAQRATGAAGLGGYAAEKSDLAARKNAAETVRLLDGVIAATKQATAAEDALAEMRRQSGSELVQNEQQLADLRKNPVSRDKSAAGDAIRAEIQALEKRNLALAEGVRLVDDEIKRADQLKFDRTQRANSAEILAGVTLPFEQRINAATTRGDSAEASRLEIVKQVATLEKQIEQAKRIGGNDQQVAALEIQKAGVIANETARQRQFNLDRSAERGANDATLRRQPREALAIRDAKELYDLKQSYRAAGLTDKQAEDDYAQRIRLEALNGGASVSTSSLASIGGGGGIGSGLSPTDAAQQRMVALQEAQAGYLRQILAVISTQRPNLNFN
jgi:hypothetical protein